MNNYNFKIGNTSMYACLENDEEAKEFAEFIGAELEKHCMIVKLQKDNKFCMFELELKDFESSEIIRNLEFMNVRIWEVPKQQ